MKKLFFALFAVLLACTACSNKEKEAEYQSRIDSLLTANNMTAAELHAYIELVNSVSESMDYITQAEDEVKISANGENAAAQREAIKEKVKNLANVVNQQRDRIAQLEEKLKADGRSNTQLQNVIKMMKQQLDEKDAMILKLQAELEDKNANIAALTQDLNTANVRNTELSTVVSQQQETITAQTDQMNEAYVKIATKRELKDAGLLKGNFFQKKKVNVNNIDRELFQKIDIRQTKTFSIPAKSAKILSQVPEGSYTLTTEDGVTTLTITDPEKFWSLTSFLIIQY